MLQTTPNWQRRTLLFLISQCITLFGSTLVQMAIVWYVTLQTASGLWLAAFSVCSYLPQFLISFIGGVWADRYNRKRLIILSDGLIAAVTLLMYLIMPYLTNQPLLLGALLVMSVIRSLGAGVQTPAVNAVLPQLVPAGQLMRYNGLNAAMQSVVNFAAPAAAGAVLSISSLHTTLLIDVLTAALGIGLFSCLLIPSQAKQTAEPTDLWSDLKIGLNYAFKEPLIGRLLMIYGLFVLLCVPAGFMAGLLVSRIFGSDYWYLTAVELVGFAGMTLGGLLMSIWGGFSSRLRTLASSLACFGLLAIGLGMSANFQLYLLLMLLFGIALTCVQTAVTTLIQENALANIQGRIFGLMSSMYAGFLPLGMAVFGPLADIMPLQWLMVASGLGLLGCALFVSRSKQMHRTAHSG